MANNPSFYLGTTPIHNIGIVGALTTETFIFTLTTNATIEKDLTLADLENLGLKELSIEEGEVKRITRKSTGEIIWEKRVIITAVPTQANSLTYTGSIQSPSWNNYSSTQLVLGGTTSGTNAGTYTATFTPQEYYCWSDGSIGPIEVEWTISKAAGNLVISPTTLALTPDTPTGTIEVARAGTGAITATSSATSIATTSVSGNIVTVTSTGTEGNATITIAVAADTNYTAPTNKTCAISYAIPVSTRTMTVVVDLSDSNPDTCCTYADDATSMTAKSTEWDEFFGHYPVLLLNGAESKKLNPNNYAQDINGNSVDITSGSAGDVMVAFPRRGLKLTTSGTTLTISFTDEQDNNDFEYYAHQRGTTAKDVFYMGAYDGYVDSNGKLRSLSGKTPTANKTIGAFRTAAQLNGSGYEQFCFFQLLYLQCMYIMKYKSLNGQTALGNGYVDSSNSAPLATGTLNANGLDYGSTANQTTAMKFAGIENFWGNIYKWTDGCVTDSSRTILTTTTGFNDSGSNYEFTTTGPTNNTGGYMVTPQGTSEAGFVIKTKNGSNSTYFSDYALCFASRVAYFSGYWNDGLYAGPFLLYVSSSASDAYSYVGARLSFFPV